MKKIIIIAFILVIGVSIIQIKQQSEKLSEKEIENYVETYTQKWYESKLNLDLGATRPFAGSTYTLAGSGITSAGTSITLQSLTIPQNDYEIQDADLSDTFYITLEPGSKKRQEIASCTTVTQNSNDTATLSGCTRGLSPITPFTSSSTLKFAHAGGTQVIFSDPPQLFNEYVSLANNETIAGTKTFTSIQYFDVFPEISSAISPTNTLQFVTKAYADVIANQGAATSTEDVGGISELATKAEQALGAALVADQPLVLGSHYASSTPSGDSNSAQTIVISESDGFLNQLWLDLSEGFIWTSEHTFLDGVTTTGVTTTGFYLGTSKLSDVSSNVNDTNLNLLTAGTGSYVDSLHSHASSTDAYASRGFLIDLFRTNKIISGFAPSTDDSNGGNAGTLIGNGRAIASGGTINEWGSIKNTSVNFSKSSTFIASVTLGHTTEDSGFIGLSDDDGGTPVDAHGKYTKDHAGFLFVNHAGVETTNGLMASVGDGTNQSTTTIAGITVTDENKYRIEFDTGAEARFYVNDVLKVTLSTYLADVADAANDVLFLIRENEASSKTMFIDSDWLFIQEY